MKIIKALGRACYASYSMFIATIWVVIALSILSNLTNISIIGVMANVLLWITIIGTFINAWLGFGK